MNSIHRKNISSKKKSHWKNVAGIQTKKILMVNNNAAWKNSSKINQQSH